MSCEEPRREPEIRDDSHEDDVDPETSAKEEAPHDKRALGKGERITIALAFIAVILVPIGWFVAPIVSNALSEHSQGDQSSSPSPSQALAAASPAHCVVSPEDLAPLQVTYDVGHPAVSETEIDVEIVPNNDIAKTVDITIAWEYDEPFEFDGAVMVRGEMGLAGRDLMLTRDDGAPFPIPNKGECGYWVRELDRLEDIVKGNVEANHWKTTFEQIPAGSDFYFTIVMRCRYGEFEDHGHENFGVAYSPPTEVLKVDTSK